MEYALSVSLLGLVSWSLDDDSFFVLVFSYFLSLGFHLLMNCLLFLYCGYCVFCSCTVGIKSSVYALLCAVSSVLVLRTWGLTCMNI